MTEIFRSFAFQVAVSDKRKTRLGSGANTQLADRLVYFLAGKSPGKPLTLTPLNAHFHPAGEGRPVSLETLVEHFRPEPLIYYNRVKPVMEKVEGLVQAGQASLEAGNLDRAEELFRRVLSLDHANVRAIFGLGLVYLKAGSLEDATHVFTQIMELPTAFSEEYRHLFNAFGIQMRRRGLLEQAVAYYLKAVAFDVEDEHLYFNLARAQYDAQDFEGASGSIRIALVLNPGFEPARRMLPVLEKAMGVESLSRELVLPPAREALSYEGLDLDGLPWE